MIEQRSIENLLANVDIVDLIGSYVSLKKSGSSWVGLCPFHDDKSPSMHVNSAKGFYHCFSCGAGGNAIKFVMEMDKLNYPQAIEKIADMFGFELIYTQQKAQKKDNSAKEILDLLNNFYKRELFNPANAAALRYLQERALSSAMIEKFELGWAPSSSSTIAVLQNAKIEPQKAFRAGAIKSGENGVYASFSNRITFPIFNHLGVLVGFGGRTISDHPAKYINSPQSDVFDKSRILYGYDKAKHAIFKQKEVIICEGYMDCIMLHQAGFNNAVAVLGTALTPKHLPLLNKENIKVILSFDSDEAGQKAALRSAEILAHSSIDGRVVLIQGGKDPAELVAANKIAELAEFYKGGVEFVEFVIRKKIEQNPNTTPLEKARVLDEIRKFTSTLRAEIISFYEPLVAEILGIDIHSVMLRKIPNSRGNFSRNYAFENTFQGGFQGSFQSSWRNSKNLENSKNPENLGANFSQKLLNTCDKKDILELSVLKNLVNNIEFRRLANEQINAQMFKNKDYYNAYLSGDENFLRFLLMNEELENYDETQFLRAIKTLQIGFLEKQKKIIANSTSDEKFKQIKELTNAIERLKKENVLSRFHNCTLQVRNTFF